jgi:hypothetical protein
MNVVYGPEPFERMLPVGTVVQATDRRYIVAPNGSWRVLDYQPAPKENA